MQSATYHERRSRLGDYFDRTAVDAWARLTSDAPVSRIRATVRAGRDRMRSQLLSWLPDDLSGRRVLDAGCGTGALAVAAAQRGADVVAVDLSRTLTDLARDRQPISLGAGRVDFVVGDMLDPSLGRFDHVVAMDSLIHYDATDMLGALAALSARAERSVCFTFAPATPALTLMHLVGRAFPKADRAPAIVPVAARRLTRAIGRHSSLAGWSVGRDGRVASGFYTSHAMELIAG